jgi:predicted negative regulator of RcsB-dependent stress response
MLLALIIAWLVVVLFALAWTGLRGWQLWKTARAAQSNIESHVLHAGLAQLPERMAELEQRQARLAEAMSRLQASVAECRVLWLALTAVTGRLTTARGFFTSK